MVSDLFQLSLQSVMRKKRSTLLILFTLTASFACSIIALSLVTSMYETNAELRLSTYGEWYLSIPQGKEEDAEWLAQQYWAEEVVSSCVYGEMLTDSGSKISFGNLDDAFLAIARSEIVEGHLPSKEGEVALTEQSLKQIGYDTYELGQVISIPLAIFSTVIGDSETVEKVGISHKYEFTLCGVLKDFGLLWQLNHNKMNVQPVHIAMTEKTARAVLDDLNDNLRTRYPGVTYVFPTEQYYIRVNTTNHAEAATQTEKHMRMTRDLEKESFQPCVNYAAYPPAEDANVGSNNLYVVLIAAVTLVAVLSIYLMNLSAEVHSFCVLRSIGVTKNQLLVMLLFESIMLAVPAILMGIPLGAGLTWVALRAFLYSGSVRPYVVIPYASLQLLFIMWLALILLARLIVFAITIHTPLTGRMQMKAKALSGVRSAIVILLLMAFGITAIYSAEESITPRYWIHEYRVAPTYIVSGYVSGGAPLVTEEQSLLFSNIPGIDHVEGFLQKEPLFSTKDNSSVLITLEEDVPMQVAFYVVDDAYWDETFDFEKDRDAFHNGDVVLLCFSNSSENSIDQPYGELILSAIDNTTNQCVAQLETKYKIRRIAEAASSRTRFIGTDYTVVCSEAYLKRLLSTMESGSQWGYYTSGDTFGYREIWVIPDTNVADTSTDLVIKAVCEQENLALDSNFEEFQMKTQSLTQELILLYACGGCIALVTLLLLASALALEAEQERRSFTILRVIGMSLRQMRRKVFGKALWRSVFAVAAGWALYSALCIRTQLALNEYTLAEAAKRAWSSFTYYGGGPTFIAALSAAMLAVLLGVSLLSKRGLKESTRLK